VLVGASGLSYEEAAKVCNCPTGTIKSRVSRARRSLLEILARGELKFEKRLPGLAMGSLLADAALARLRAAVVAHHQPGAGPADQEIRQQSLAGISETQVDNNKTAQ